MVNYKKEIFALPFQLFHMVMELYQHFVLGGQVSLQILIYLNGVHC